MVKITSKINYQALTNKILREATFDAGSSADYANPIRAIEMQGNFMLRLKSSKFKFIRILFALTFFIIPAIAGILLPLILEVHPTTTEILNYAGFCVLCLLSLLVGFKIIYPR